MQRDLRSDSRQTGDHERGPDSLATGVFLGALVITPLFLGGDSPVQMARTAAILVGLGLAGMALLEMRHGWRRVFRADLMALCALYFLTLFEFWFSQFAFERRMVPQLVEQGINLLLWGFAGIAIGRHIVLRPSTTITRLVLQPTPQGLLVGIFSLFFLLGYLHWLISVNFDIVALVDHMMGRRFSQPWSRGRYGGWDAILSELGLFRYLIPPLAGVILARAGKFPTSHVMAVAAALLFTLFSGFASGTRNIFGTYLLTFVVGYSFALPSAAWKRAGVVGALAAILLFWSTSVMLSFRNTGLKDYLAGRSAVALVEHETSNVFVDYNLQNLSNLTEVFPDIYDYLGWEIPYLALVKPIPRAIWPEKPAGMSVGIESALGAQGRVTLSVTFVGEAYMSWGVLGVIAFGLLYGAMSGWWSCLLRSNSSDLGILIYASGFFAFAIGMRSLLWATTGMLPALGAIVIGSYLLKRSSKPHGQPVDASGVRPLRTSTAARSGGA